MKEEKINWQKQLKLLKMREGAISKWISKKLELISCLSYIIF